MDNRSQTNPYVGPQAFERYQRDLFFGRDQDAESILSFVISERVVLFYAQSGAGKSSLVNAKLIPDLEREGFDVLPVARVGGELLAEIASQQGVNIYIFNTLWYLTERTGNPQDLAGTTLKEFLTHKAAGKDDEIQQRVLIFDQFEEILSTHPEFFQQREDFFRQIERVLEADPMISVVFVMREDHIAELDSYAPLVRGRFRTRFRLERLSYENAITAVRRPAEIAKKPFDPGVAETLVDNLRQMQSEGQKTTVPGKYVEPVQLQVVCFQLWENLFDRPAETITRAHLEKFGDVNLALENFYESAVERVGEKTGVPQDKIRRWFGKTLITPNRIRSQVNRGANKTVGLPNTAVDLLVDSHLVRVEKARGGTWIELVHDRFIEPILAANERWFSEKATPLSTSARDWDKANRHESFLIRGQQLADAKNWVKANEEWVDEVEQAFIGASELLEEREEAERVEATRKLAEESEARLKAEERARREAEQLALQQSKAAKKMKFWLRVLAVVSILMFRRG